MKKIIALLFIIASFQLFSQSADRKNHNFNVGDAICSTNGKILGGNWFVADYLHLENFIGIYSGIENEKNASFSEIFKSSGATYVNLIPGEIIKKGEFITIKKDGKAEKLSGEGISIGVALEDSQNGKVKIFIETTYRK